MWVFGSVGKQINRCINRWYAFLFLWIFFPCNLLHFLDYSNAFVLKTTHFGLQYRNFGLKLFCMSRVCMRVRGLNQPNYIDIMSHDATRMFSACYSIRTVLNGIRLGLEKLRIFFLLSFVFFLSFYSPPPFLYSSNAIPLFSCAFFSRSILSDSRSGRIELKEN